MVRSESKHRNSRSSADGWWRFRPSENSAQLPCCFGLVISVIDVTCKIYSVLASNGLAFTLRVSYSCTCHQRDRELRSPVSALTARYNPSILVGLTFSFLNKVGSLGNLNQLHVTLFLLLFALQSNAAQ